LLRFVVFFQLAGVLLDQVADMRVTRSRMWCAIFRGLKATWQSSTG